MLLVGTYALTSAYSKALELLNDIGEQNLSAQEKELFEHLPQFSSIEDRLTSQRRKLSEDLNIIDLRGIAKDAFEFYRKFRLNIKTENLKYVGDEVILDKEVISILQQKLGLKEIPVPSAALEYEYLGNDNTHSISKIIDSYISIEKQYHIIQTPSGKEKTMVAYIDKLTGQVKEAEVLEKDTTETSYVSTVVYGIHSVLNVLIDLATWGGVSQAISDLQESIEKLQKHISSDENLALLTHLIGLHGYLAKQDVSFPFSSRKPIPDPDDFGGYGGDGNPNTPSSDNGGLMGGSSSNGTIASNSTDLSW